MKLTVNIVTTGRFEEFQRCILSTIDALPPENAEVLVILNGPNEKALNFLCSLNHPQFRWIHTPRERLAHSRNRALALAKGEIFYCLDDDVEVPPFLFAEALEQLERNPNIAILGGPNLTPSGSTRLQRAFGAVMTSWFACPMVRQRYLSRKIGSTAEQSLIFCNLAIRKALIPENLRFYESLRSNEENLFLYSARKAGLCIQFSPVLFVYHRRRTTLLAFAQQIFSYGYGRSQQSFKEPWSCHPAFLLPALVWLLIIAGLTVPGGLTILLCFAGLHLLLSTLAVFSTRSSLSIPLTPVVHLSYGAGILWGVLKTICQVVAFEIKTGYDYLLSCDRLSWTSLRGILRLRPLPS